MWGQLRPHSRHSEVGDGWARERRVAVAATALILGILLLSGCGNDVEARRDPPTMSSATAAVLDPRASTVTAQLHGDAPLEVTSGELIATSDPPGAWAKHVVSIRNISDRTVGIDDVRFSSVPMPTGSKATRSNLITAGFQCGVASASADDPPAPSCRLGERSIILGPGETHGDDVTVYARLSGASAEEGSYALEQQVTFWFDPAGTGFTRSAPSGTTTVRVEYHLRR